MIDKEIGKRIRHARKASFEGSGSAFAREKLNVNYSVLHMWENGLHVPGASALAKIAAATNVTIDWIITGKDPVDENERFNVRIPTRQLRKKSV